jgi:hypothetical protein
VLGDGRQADVIEADQEHFLDYGHAFSSTIMAGLWALSCHSAGALLAARRTGPGPA